VSARFFNGKERKMATGKKATILNDDKAPVEPGLTTVQLYDCEIRLGGDIMHTQERKGITNGEIRLIRAIHGESGVVKVVEAGTKDVSEKDELFALAVKYSKDIDPRPGVKLVEKVFGVELVGFDEWNAERGLSQDAVRREHRAKSQEEATRLSRARDAAEAKVRSEIADEKV
jgi:hypothetical protein